MSIKLQVREHGNRTEGSHVTVPSPTGPTGLPRPRKARSGNCERLSGIHRESSQMQEAGRTAEVATAAGGAIAQQRGPTLPLFRWAGGRKRGSSLQGLLATAAQTPPHRTAESELQRTAVKGAKNLNPALRVG